MFVDARTRKLMKSKYLFTIARDSGSHLGAIVRVKVVAVYVGGDVNICRFSTIDHHYDSFILGVDRRLWSWTVRVDRHHGAHVMARVAMVVIIRAGDGLNDVEVSLDNRNQPRVRSALAVQDVLRASGCRSTSHSHIHGPNIMCYWRRWWV